MTCWVHKVTSAAEVNVGVSLNDRTIWATCPDIPEKLTEALKISKECDDLFGLMENPDKVKSSATGGAVMFEPATLSRTRRRTAVASHC